MFTALYPFGEFEPTREPDAHGSVGRGNVR